MNSLCLNVFVVHYVLDKHLVPADWALALYSGTAVWVAWVGLARVYMGLHTPIDIGAGVLLGILVLVFYLAVDGIFAFCSLALYWLYVPRMGNLLRRGFCSCSVCTVSLNVVPLSSRN